MGGRSLTSDVRRRTREEDRAVTQSPMRVLDEKLRETKLIFFFSAECGTSLLWAQSPRTKLPRSLSHRPRLKMDQGYHSAVVVIFLRFLLLFFLIDCFGLLVHCPATCGDQASMTLMYHESVWSPKSVPGESAGGQHYNHGL
jgi:hypothetical protein